MLTLKTLDLQGANVRADYRVYEGGHEFDGVQRLMSDEVEDVTLGELREETSSQIVETLGSLNFRVNNVRRIFASTDDYEPTSYEVDFSTPRPVDGNSINGRLTLEKEEYEASGSDTDKVRRKVAQLVSHPDEETEETTE